ncbi:hypothetical protein B0H17DRAFT_1124021 [Mycena rosella]|uniref:Uncharacterized protein n=1 Tax=Mycena rosella TaxID=1033263 RepID=A0AAD7H3G8_MYCRO|nr:hypothetical protein B0H17DRAFT_1124021 [Mycena rosella]
MSSFNILGFFQLKGGRRVSTQKPESTFLIWHAHYNSNIWCTTANSRVPAEIRLYTSSTTPLLPDGTVAFAMCAAQLSANHRFFLDVPTLIVMPGDPTSSTYDDHLPDENTAFTYGVGRISGGSQILDDGHSSRVVTVAVSDFVRGETRTSTIQTPVPATNSMVQFYGACRDITSDGVLRIKLECIVLNIGSTAQATSASQATTSSALVTLAKRRKFDPPPSDTPAADITPVSAVPMPPATTSPSDVSARIGSSTHIPDNPFHGKLGPMHYNQLFQAYGQPYMQQPPASFPGQSAVDFFTRPYGFSSPPQTASTGKTHAKSKAAPLSQVFESAPTEPDHQPESQTSKSTTALVALTSRTPLTRPTTRRTPASQ